jgi:hypothetical protein
MQVVPQLHGTPLLVTLTVRNVPGEQLSATLDQMLLAWNKMQDRRQVRRGLLGWARNLEITYNQARDDYHPHIHAIIYTRDLDMAKASFWGNLWREVMQLDYDPIIDVRPIKDGAGAVAEISKYVTKVGSILDLPDGIVDDVVQTLATALYKRRLRAYGGEWARVRRAIGAVDEDKLTDEQVDGLSDQVEGIECCGHEMVEVVMRWTGDEYEVTRADDGSPMVVPEPEAVAPWPD